jgi:hypothetical protein
MLKEALMIQVTYLYYKFLINQKQNKNEKAFILISTGRSYRHPKFM